MNDFRLLPRLLALWLTLAAMPALSESAPALGSSADLSRAGQRNATMLSHFAVHPNFDRLVVDLARGAQFTVQQDEQILFVHVGGKLRVTGGGVAGRRLQGIANDSNGFHVQTAAGMPLKVWRLAGRLIIDVLDQSPHSSAVTAPNISMRKNALPSENGAQHEHTKPPAISPSTAPLAAITASKQTEIPGTDVSRPVAVETKLAPGSNQSAGRLGSAPRSAVPSAEHSGADTGAMPAGPSSEAAVSLMPISAGLPGPAIFIPFKAKTGAAAFSRGGEAHVIFDAPAPLDLSSLRDDPIFGRLTERVLANGTQLSLNLPKDKPLRLLKRDGGWILLLPAAPTSMEPIAGHLQNDGLMFDAEAPGHVVVVEDETTGERLLVGTQTDDGQFLAANHVGAEFYTVPTWQGVVVEPASDRLAMTTRPNGFLVSTSGRAPLSLVWNDRQAGAWPEGRTVTRLFDFSNLPAATLHRRMGEALQDAAAMPKLSRFDSRLRVAQAMLAQGLDVEAASVLQTAKADDPAHEGDPKAEGLTAIAAWMSASAGGAPAPEPGFALERLGQSDEAALWRTLLQPKNSGTEKQATVVAATWPLLLDYPAALRGPLLRPIGLVLTAGGQKQALSAFLKANPDLVLDPFRAAQLAAEGKIDESLALLDKVSRRPDRRARAEALEASVEIRLRSKRLQPLAAADALERQIYAWREDDRELRLRRRVAQLQAQGGSWRAALALLRQTEAQIPGAHDQIYEDEKTIIGDLLGNEHAARLSAFDVVTLADEASTLLRPGDIAAGLGPVLADKLLSLDLPERAEPILRRMFEGATDNPTRATLGLRLAGLAGRQGDPTRALTILGASNDDGLEPATVNQRALLRGSLLAASGQPREALAALAGQEGRAVRELRASILEARHDPAGASAILKPFLKSEEFKKLTDADQRAMILHLARDQSEARDGAGLRQLRAGESTRFNAGQGAELFALLTAEPIGDTSDLPRSRNEISAIRGLPSQLEPRTAF